MIEHQRILTPREHEWRPLFGSSSRCLHYDLCTEKHFTAVASVDMAKSGMRTMLTLMLLASGGMAATLNENQASLVRRQIRSAGDLAPNLAEDTTEAAVESLAYTWLSTGVAGGPERWLTAAGGGHGVQHCYNAVVADGGCYDYFTYVGRGDKNCGCKGSSGTLAVRSSPTADIYRFVPGGGGGGGIPGDSMEQILWSNAEEVCSAIKICAKKYPGKWELCNAGYLSGFNTAGCNDWDQCMEQHKNVLQKQIARLRARASLLLQLGSGRHQPADQAGCTDPFNVPECNCQIEMREDCKAQGHSPDSNAHWDCMEALTCLNPDVCNSWKATQQCPGHTVLLAVHNTGEAVKASTITDTSNDTYTRAHVKLIGDKMHTRRQPLGNISSAEAMALLDKSVSRKVACKNGR